MFTIYPPLPPQVRNAVAFNVEQGLPAYSGFDVELHAPGIIASRAKHFTDAELAAEFEAARCDSILTQQVGYYWSPFDETWTHDKEAVIDRATTLLRFATADHALEA